MTPATPVPCSSAGRAAGDEVWLAWTWPARSGWLASTPLSTTATRTPRPVATACSSASRHARAAGCSAEQRVVVRLGGLGAVDVHRLGPGDARLARQRGGDVLRGTAGGQRRSRSSRGRPAASASRSTSLRPCCPRDAPGDAQPGGAAGAVAVGARRSWRRRGSARPAGAAAPAPAGRRGRAAAGPRRPGPRPRRAARQAGRANRARRRHHRAALKRFGEHDVGALRPQPGQRGGAVRGGTWQHIAAGRRRPVHQPRARRP